MPILKSNYSPSWPLRNCDIQSILPTLIRKISLPNPLRKSINTPDGDFLLLDSWENRSSKTAIISHGLEGSTNSHYMRGMTRILLAQGWNVIAWNMRGCGGIQNKIFSWYHSGQSEDLREIVNYVLSSSDNQIALIGFSVGGNITLKYLAEEGKKLDQRILRAATISPPVDLRSSATVLAKRRNRIYMKYLLSPLKRRLREKEVLFPGSLDLTGIDAIKTFHEFDMRYTAPIHGFKSLDHYWDSASSLPLLRKITIPTLILSANDDPFLAPECYPFAIASNSQNIFLEVPPYGGHVGFIKFDCSLKTWADERVSFFLGK